MKTTSAGLVVLVTLAWPTASVAAAPQLDFLTGPSSASPEEVVRGYRPEVARMKLVSRSVSPDDITHLSYNAMVGIGFALIGLVAWFAFAWWRRRDLPRSRWFLCFVDGAR